MIDIDARINEVSKIITDIVDQSDSTPEQKLKLLKGVIKSHKVQVERLARDTIEAAVRLGQTLAAAKSLAKHGTWETWVKKNCGFTPRHANRLIHLAEYYQSLTPPNRTSMSGLTLSAAIAMAKQKPDFATFDADQFAASIDESQPDEPEDEPAIQPAPEEKKPAPPLAVLPAPITPKPTPEPAVEDIKSLEGEWLPAAPKAPEPEPKPPQGATIDAGDNQARPNIQTKEKLLIEAKKIIGMISRGEKVSPTHADAWLAAYDVVRIKEWK